MRTPVSSLRVGDYIDDVFLQVDYRRLPNRRTGRDGIKWTCRDVTGTITVIAWVTTPDQLAYGHTWTTMRVRGNVEPDTYAGEGALQIKADAVYFEAVESLEGLEPVTTLTVEDYRTALESYTERLRSPLRELVERVLADPYVDANFSHIAAGRSMHHAVRGGLLQHTTEVVWIADAMAGALKQAGEELNWDLVVAGAILHDCGKVDELIGDGAVVEYGRGTLLGHITLGQFRIRDAASGIAGFHYELLEEILHVVGAHHGKKEYGSPVEPAMLEADIVHLADLASAWSSARRERQTGGVKLFERHPILIGGHFTGARWGAEKPAPSTTVSRGMQFVNLPPKSPPAEDQPSLFGEAARQRAGCAPKPVAAARLEDIDDPFCDS